MKARAEIVQKDDPILRQKAKTVLRADIGTKKLNDVIARMKVALDAEADGVAIAAPQIGVSLRIFVVSHRAFSLNGEKKSVDNAGIINARDMVFINPEITKLSRKKVKVPEGCLSVRWLYGNTMRAEKASVNALDEYGKKFTYGGSGLLAQIFQHETDHLNGVLFIDHATEVEELPPEKVEEIKNAGKKKGGQ